MRAREEGEAGRSRSALVSVYGIGLRGRERLAVVGRTRQRVYGVAS